MTFFPSPFHSPPCPLLPPTSRSAFILASFIRQFWVPLSRIDMHLTFRLSNCHPFLMPLSFKLPPPVLVSGGWRRGPSLPAQQSCSEISRPLFLATRLSPPCPPVLGLIPFNVENFLGRMPVSGLSREQRRFEALVVFFPHLVFQCFSQHVKRCCD